ncbi:copper resistance CopC family protein [Acidisoma sp. C75]
MKRVLLAAAGLMLFSQVPAFAHAYPKTESPAKGAVLHQAPTTAWIEFDDELEPAFTGMKVVDAHGRVVSEGKAKVSPGDHHHLSVALGPMKPGQYRVVWHATDTDTHKTHGSYSFRLAQ